MLPNAQAAVVCPQCAVVTLGVPGKTDVSDEAAIGILLLPCRVGLDSYSPDLP